MVVTDSAVLFDFEDGTQGWQVAPDWPQVTVAKVVDSALVMSGAWTGDGWNEGGVFVQNDEGRDLIRDNDRKVGEHFADVVAESEGEIVARPEYRVGSIMPILVGLLA
jgi:hypothetical protein